MAWEFDGTGKLYADITPSVIDCGPDNYTFSVACKFKVDDLTASRALWCISADLTGQNYLYRIVIRDDGDVRFVAKSTTASSFDTASLISTGTWYSVVAVSAAQDDREIFVDGISRATSSVSKSISFNAHDLTLGSNADSSNQFDGMLQDWALWDGVLTADDALAYHNGISPLLIRPHELRHYIPLDREARDVVGGRAGGFTMTDSGTTGYAEHQRIIQPNTPKEIALPRWPYIEGTIP